MARAFVGSGQRSRGRRTSITTLAGGGLVSGTATGGWRRRKRLVPTFVPVIPVAAVGSGIGSDDDQRRRWRRAVAGPAAAHRRGRRRQRRKFRKVHHAAAENSSCSRCIGQLRAQHENERLSALFFARAVAGKLVDAGVVGRPFDFSSPVAKNQHRQPSEFCITWFRCGLQRVEAGAFAIMLFADELVDIRPQSSRRFPASRVAAEIARCAIPGRTSTRRRCRPACNCPPMMANSCSTAACTAGNRFFMSAEVSKMNRKRLSQPLAPPAGRRAPESKKFRRRARDEPAHAKRRCERELFIGFCSFARALETVPLRAIVVPQFVLQFRQRISTMRMKFAQLATEPPMPLTMSRSARSSVTTSTSP